MINKGIIPNQCNTDIAVGLLCFVNGVDDAIELDVGKRITIEKIAT